MNEKYEDENKREMINLACILDPRFMMKVDSLNEQTTPQHSVYTSPELIKNITLLTKQSDIYSLILTVIPQTSVSL